MFKNLYNNIINLHLNFKLNKNINLFTFLKKSSLLKNYSNYLNYYIFIYNNLYIKTIQTVFWNTSPNNITAPIIIILLIWLFIDLLI